MPASRCRPSRDKPHVERDSVMLQRNRWRYGRAAVAALLAGGVLAGLGGSEPAHADPLSVTALNGVGGDGLQDVWDAYAGAAPTPLSANTQFYTPLHSSAATNNITLQSFNSYPPGGSIAAPGCITTKAGGPSFDRPSSSGNGVNALLAAVNGTGWVNPSASCTVSPVSVTGQIDWVR